MALNYDRDFKHIIYFMDNYSAQNKNWKLYTAMLDIVNSNKISAESITFSYLETGHTFMSADSIHAEVKKRIRAKKNIYDFTDFVDSIRTGKIDVVLPKANDFKNLEGKQSQPKLKSRPCLLPEIREVQFIRGKSTMFIKLRHSDREFTEFDFIQKKFKPGAMNFQSLRSTDRGIPESKKEDMSKLVPLMPAHRHGFWERLSTSNLVADLIDNENY